MGPLGQGPAVCGRDPLSHLRDRFDYFEGPLLSCSAIRTSDCMRAIIRVHLPLVEGGCLSILGLISVYHILRFPALRQPDA